MDRKRLFENIFGSDDKDGELLLDLGDKKLADFDLLVACFGDEDDSDDKADYLDSDSCSVSFAEKVSAAVDDISKIVGASGVPFFIGEEKCGLDAINEVFEFFLEEKKCTDVSFSVKCGDGWIDFDAHKLILSMWSPVFAEMCYEHSRESESSIRIEDVSPTTFDAMLKFMYGSFLDKQRKDIPYLLKLYKAAVAYKIEALKNFCSEKFMCADPDKNNVFQLLDAGELLNCEMLVQRCKKILQTKTAEVLAAQELCNITPAMLITVLDMPRVSFTSEYELISWVLAWVKNELLKQPYQKSFKDILADFLPYLNFLNLTAEELAKLYQNRKGDLLSEQEGFSIFMNIALPGSHPLPSWCSSSPKHREYRNQNSSSLSSLNSLGTGFISLG